ncbi:MAG: histidine phosphatase family protein [Hyphomicrobium sp.]
MLRLDLLRHGDTGRAGYLDGRTDCPLTASGVLQMARQTAACRWPLVIASPLQRARSPAEAFAMRVQSRVVVDPDWAELDFGRWDGKLRRDIEADTGERDLLAAYYDDPESNSPPDGERWTDFEARVRSGLTHAFAQAAGQQTLVITHAGPMRLALSIVLGIPIRSLWAVRIGYATRVGLEVGRSDDGKFWGELVEIVQP